MHVYRLDLRLLPAPPALALVTLLAVGCGGDPEPAPEPRAEPVRREATPGAEEPRRRPADDASRPPRAAPATAERAPQQPSQPVTITLRTFPQSVLAKLKVDDVVEVELTNGGVVRGKIRGLRPRLLTIMTGTGKSSSLLSQHRPEHVRDVRLLQRSTRELIVSAKEGPRNEAETWLPEHADGEILGADAAELWGGRFAASIPLRVEREFKLPVLTFSERTNKAFFGRQVRSLVLQRGDQIKLVGTTTGYQELRGEEDHAIGEVYLYLVRRGQTVFPACSLERLHLADLDRKALARWLEYERVTLVISRPGTGELVRVSRIPARVARQYRDHIERTPDRPAIRRMRAKGDPELPQAEQRVQTLYKAVGLTEPDALDRPLKIAFTLPAAEEGSIHLLPYTKELGLD